MLRVSTVRFVEITLFPLFFDFSSYCRQALTKVPELSPDVVDEMLADEFSWKELAENGWKNVLVFYLLRLCAAPVAETILLLDRMFFLFENG